MRNKREVSTLLGLLERALEEMTDAEYTQLLDGKARLKVFPIDRKGKGGLKESSKVSTEELQTLADELRERKSREEARALLNNDLRFGLRDNLEQLARLLQVHVNKHDSRDIIEDKIIESVIGVRLRSEAIQGLNLKGSGTIQGSK